VAKYNSNTIITFADDTAVVGLISDNDETAYREEVRDVTVWCQDNNLSLSVSKTKELIVDYRKGGLNMPQGCSGGGRDFQDPWSPHHQQTIMVQTHHSGEECTTTPFPTQETKRIWHGSPDSGKVIQLHHREYPDRLQHHLEWQLLGI
jgi:hypothetical protein